MRIICMLIFFTTLPLSADSKIVVSAKKLEAEIMKGLKVARKEGKASVIVGAAAIVAVAATAYYYKDDIRKGVNKVTTKVRGVTRPAREWLSKTLIIGDGLLPPGEAPRNRSREFRALRLKYLAKVKADRIAAEKKEQEAKEGMAPLEEILKLDENK